MLLAEIAREDDDPRVRRAAVAKLMDPAALATRGARRRRRRRARRRRPRCCATSRSKAFEGIGEAESLAAVATLDGLHDAKTLAVVAKTAPREATAAHALAADHRRAHARIDRAARRARVGAAQRVRRAARSPPRCSASPSNSDFKDPTLAAVERVHRSAGARADRRAGEEQERPPSARGASCARWTSATAQRRSRREATPRPRRWPRPKRPRAAERDAAAREQAAREAAARQAAEDAGASAETERVRAHEEAEAHRRAEHDAAERARREAEEEAARKETERRHARLAELADDAVKTAAARRDLAAARRQFTSFGASGAT